MGSRGDGPVAASSAQLFRLSSVGIALGALVGSDGQRQSVKSAGDHAAIHGEHLAGDIGGGWAG